MNDKQQKKTASSEKHAANRNPNRSTGPRTAQGKQRASQNSYKHGFYATRLFPNKELIARDGGRLQKNIGLSIGATICLLEMWKTCMSKRLPCTRYVWHGFFRTSKKCSVFRRRLKCAQWTKSYDTNRPSAADWKRQPTNWGGCKKHARQNRTKIQMRRPTKGSKLLKNRCPKNRRTAAVQQSS